SFKMSFTLFPYYCCDHLHLYSFPTRRSSDLSGSTNDLSTLDGGPGNDMLFGSLVNSTYVFRSGNGQDEIHDYDPTFYMFMGKVQQGSETLHFVEGVEESDLTFSLDGNDLVIHVGTGTDSIRIKEWLASKAGAYSNRTRFSAQFGTGTLKSLNSMVVISLSGMVGQEYILTGTDGADSIYGFIGNDVITGGAGNDTLYGDSGADQLNGGDGVDTLYGGTDNDVLSGGNDNDKLYGEAGDDVLNGGEGADSLYGGDDNDTLNGDAGDDRLDGGNGNDIAYGGDGNDILHDGGTSYNS